MAGNPLVWDTSSEDVRPASAGHVETLIERGIFHYSSNPSVELSYVASGGNLNSIDDTRYAPSAGLSRADRFPTSAETGAVDLITVSQQKIQQTKATVTKPTNAKPLAYVTNTGNIRALPIDEAVELLVKPAIDRLNSKAAIDDENRGGTYFVTTSVSAADADNVSSQPIYTDTNANVSFYDAERSGNGLFVSLDTPAINTSWYLHKQRANAFDRNLAGTSGGDVNRYPLYVTPSGDLRHYTVAEYDNFIGELIRWAAVNLSGYILDYQVSNSSTDNTYRSSTITNTLVDSSKHFTEEVGLDDYRGQSIPQGTATIINSYYLTLSKS